MLGKAGHKRIMGCLDGIIAMINGYNNLLQLLGDMGFTFGTYLWDPRYKGLDDYVWACYAGYAGMQSQ